MTNANGNLGDSPSVKDAALALVTVAISEAHGDLDETSVSQRQAMITATSKPDESKTLRNNPGNWMPREIDQTPSQPGEEAGKQLEPSILQRHRSNEQQPAADATYQLATLDAFQSLQPEDIPSTVQSECEVDQHRQRLVSRMATLRPITISLRRRGLFEEEAAALTAEDAGQRERHLEDVSAICREWIALLDM